MADVVRPADAPVVAEDASTCVAETDCDDAVDCTADSCVDGRCVHIEVDELCDDDEPCTADRCTATGCSSDPLPDDSVCSLPTGEIGEGGLCRSGVCERVCTTAVECDDGASCTTDRCDDGVCVNDPLDTLCDDGEPCTADACTSEGCQNDPSPDTTACTGAFGGEGMCFSGACTCPAPCTGGSTCCGTGCVDTSVSAEHCGGCGIACVGDQECIAGTCLSPTECLPACSADERCCGFACVPTEYTRSGDGRADASFLHCGDCGAACDPTRANRCAALWAGTLPQCLCGNNLSCSSGRVCALTDGRFGCVDLQTDPDHCGAIGNACPGDATCTMGVCRCGSTSCAPGETCCAGSCVDLDADPQHCGGCGNGCPAHASDCNGGSCGCGTGAACVEPTPGSSGTPGDPGESCCGGVCVANTDTSCLCAPCTGDDTCQVSGGGIVPGAGVQVCCGDESVRFWGCGSGSSDGGLPFP